MAVSVSACSSASVLPRRSKGPLLHKEQGDRYKEDKAFKEERLRRWRLKRARAKERKAKEEEWEASFEQRFRSFFLGGDDSAPDTAVCYAFLGVEPPVTAEQLRAARDRKARECHPDHGGSDWMMKAVNLAYERLLKELEPDGRKRPQTRRTANPSDPSARGAIAAGQGNQDEKNPDVECPHDWQTNGTLARSAHASRCVSRVGPNAPALRQPTARSGPAETDRGR
jgi:hypothetical protein